MIAHLSNHKKSRGAVEVELSHAPAEAQPSARRNGDPHLPGSTCCTAGVRPGSAGQRKTAKEGIEI